MFGIDRLGTLACAASAGLITAMWLALAPSINAAPFDHMPAQSVARAADALPPGTGSEILRARCLGCHGTDMVRQQRLSRTAWNREVEKMSAWGAAVGDAEKATLIDYLSLYFAERQFARPSAANADMPAALLATRCRVCHDTRLIDQQRLTVQGWEREIDKMVDWGAIASTPEKAILATYLASLPATADIP